MKKSLVALAVLGTFAGVASAQSSVTLFGIVDANVRYVKTGDDSRKTLSNSGLASSRLGFRGVEDLGGGLKAGFWLESAINNDNGTSNASRFWHRRSTVSLMGGFGEVRLGRDLVPSYTAYSDFDIFGTNGIGDANRMHSVIGSGSEVLIRADNMISYILPALGGLVGQFSVAAGEGSSPSTKYYGGKLGYNAGPLAVMVGFGRNEISDDDEFDLAVLSASYDFGSFKLAGSASKAEFQEAEEQVYTIGASMPIGPGLIRASYTHTKGEGSRDGRDADQVALGYVHNLSKRTALYATVAYIKNDNAAGELPYTLPEGPASLDDDVKSRGAEFGIRHSF